MNGGSEQVLQALQRKGYGLREPFAIGRPDRSSWAMKSPSGQEVVAKFYPAGGETAFLNMQKLWRSSFGKNRMPAGLPEPLTYEADLGVLIMERLVGKLLIDFEQFDPAAWEASVRLLAALHESNAVPEVRRDPHRIVRSCHRKLKRVQELGSEHAESLTPLVEALERAAVQSDELVPSHGDFSPRNVLVCADRVALIDWDRFQWAHPARDVGYFGTWSWLHSLRHHKKPDWSVLEQCIGTYKSARPKVQLEQQLDFHVAAGLLRIAASLVTLWPQDAHWIPQITAEALRRLR